jgi:hypothetical protein
MKHFYFVADYTARFYLNVPNIMISAGASWLDGKWHDYKDLHMQRCFVDSGGFSFFRKYGKYPFTLEQYVDWIGYLQDDYPIYLVSVLDYPCEGTTNRTTLKTNEERIIQTVSNAIECIDYEDSLPWMPVIQGYTLEEYLHCIDLYEQAGIDLGYIAVGSICARKGNSLTIRNLLTKIYERTHAKLHAFGLSLNYLRDPQIANILYSSDSSAWNWGISNHCDKAFAVKKYQSLLSRIVDSGIQETLT